MKQISRNQQIFVDEYILHGNATVAYSAAYGVHVKNCGEMGYKLLHSPKIAALITEKKAEIAKQYNIDQEYLIRETLDLIKSCKDAKSEIGVTDRTNWNKAIQTLARLTGHDIQKLEIKDTTTKITVITDKYDHLIEATNVDFQVIEPGNEQEQEQKQLPQETKINFKINVKNEQIPEDRDRVDNGPLEENN